MRSWFASRRSSILGFVVVIAAACGSSDDKSSPPDPRTPQLVGSGTIDALIFDAPASDAVAASHEVKWWEVELQIEGDTIPGGSGVITPTDSTRVSIVFFGHRGNGSSSVKGHFSVDITHWLSLEHEHDAVDIAQIFSGSGARYTDGRQLDDEESAAVFNSVFDAIQTGLAAVPGPAQKSLRPSLTKKGGGGLGDLLTCVGDKKEALKGALTSLAGKFKTCASCAAKTIFGENTPEAWKECGSTCASSIMDAKGTEPLMDVLKCKNVLSVPPVEPEDTAVSRPEGMTDGGTCYAKSADKVRGTYRMTDGKGAVSCGDCPTGTVPSESVIGCAPGDESGDDDSKAIVQIPAGDNTPAQPVVITKDACLTVDVSTTGTINGTKVDPNPRRVNYRIGNRPWDQLPKVSNPSSDQVDLTSSQHQGQSEGNFEVGSEKKPARANQPDNGDTVAAAIARGGCSSDIVLGLSQQIAEELSSCVLPGKLVKVTGTRNLDVSRVPHPYLEKPAAEALVRAARAGGSAKMSLNHMFRTVAQQYVITTMKGRCPGIKKVARPGNSNHESGIALDINSYSVWKSKLEAEGFQWFGSTDRMHFDYRGAGAEDLRGNDVKAFQRLWNRNHPEDRIEEDGVYGGDTESRLLKSPASGFPLGPSAGCAIAEVKTGNGSKEPMKYVTNVLTAEQYPGQGCTTGADASHTDVNACVKSEAVCEAYWCDLAQHRDPACTGSTVKPAVAPTEKPAGKPACTKDLGEFQLTFYHIAQQADYPGMDVVPMYDRRSGALLAMGSEKFVKMSRLNGTGKTTSGKLLNWVGKCPQSPYGCFQQLPAEYTNGVGKAGRNLDYYRSIAVDPSLIPLGTRVYAEQLDGMKMPDGTVHDGWLLADDTGGAILGKHIDFFVEGDAAYKELRGKGLDPITLSPEKCTSESGI